MRTAWQLWVGGGAAAPAALVSSLLAASACVGSLPASDRPGRAPPRADASEASGYRVPGGCPSEARFRDEIERRAPAREPRPSRASATQAVHVEVTERTPSDWLGRVSFERDGTEIAREVTGARCEEVVVALALIASLWLFPAPPEDGAPIDPVAGEAATGEPVRAAPLAPTSLSPAADELPPTDGAEDRAESPSPYRVQLAGIIGYASDPSHAIKGRLKAELWGSDRPSSWAVAVGVAYAMGRHGPERLGTAALDLIHGQLDLCLPGTELASGWWLRGCGQGRAGGLHFSPPSESLQGARSLWRPWLGVGPSIHSGVVVTRAITLRAEAELSFNLVKDQFATERASSSAEPALVEASRFYETNRVSLDLGLGAAYAF